MTWLRCLFHRRARDRTIDPYLRAADEAGAGIDRYAAAAAAMTLDYLVDLACKEASAYVVKGANVNDARALAVQDLAGSIRAVHGYEMAKRWREKVTGMPVLLLLTPEAHIAAEESLRLMALAAREDHAEIVAWHKGTA